MRIAYLADSNIPSQAANCVQTLAMVSAMAEAQHDVHLLSPCHPGGVASAHLPAVCRDFAVQHNFSLHYVPRVDIAGRFKATYFALAALTARALRADLVFTRNARIGLYCVRLGCRVLLELHTLPNSARSRRAISELVQNPLVVRWVFISKTLQDLYAKQFALPLSRCLVAHDAVDMRRFEPALPTERARRLIGARQSRKTIVHCGSLYEGRGGDLLLSAVARLRNVDLWFVGGQAADIHRVRRMVPADLENHVLFAGHQTVAALPPYLFAADAVVLPTTTEGVAVDRKTRHVDYSSPMKLFEYLACGKPVVATRLRGVCEILRHGENALLVPSGESTPLYTALDRVLHDEDLARNLAAEGLAAARVRTWQARSEEILNEL